MKYFFSFTNFSKTIIFRASLALLGMTILSFSAVAFYHYDAGENIKNNTYAQMQIIRSAIAQSLWNLDYKSMNQTIESVISERPDTIVAIRILESDKILLDHAGPAWKDKKFEAMKTDEQFQHWESAVTYKDTQLGKIQVIFYVAGERRKIAQVSLFLSIGILFFTAFCVSLFQTAHLRKLSKELQKQVEERTRELDSQRMALVNSSRLASLGEMSAGIAHEINNPLTVIDGTTRLISKALAPNMNIEQVELYLKKISKMVVRISKIINGLRAFSRDGSQEPVNEFFVGRFFSDLSDLCDSSLSHKKVDVQFTVEDSNTIILGREVQLSQVMINLINNSSDAIESLDEKWIKVECYSKNDEIVFAITDSGKGIPVDIQKKMLQPFFTTKELGKGTGLGLSIAMGIIESHGGKLQYCQNHKNTRFEIILKKHSAQNVSIAA